MRVNINYTIDVDTTTRAAINLYYGRPGLARSVMPFYHAVNSSARA